MPPCASRCSAKCDSHDSSGSASLNQKPARVSRLSLTTSMNCAYAPPAIGTNAVLRKASGQRLERFSQAGHIPGRRATQPGGTHELRAAPFPVGFVQDLDRLETQR